MTRPPVIIDTNVIVVCLPTRRTTSPVAWILDGMLDAAFPFVLCDALLTEYRTVLVRPDLSRRHGMTVVEVETILTGLIRHAIILAPVAAAPAPDPGDQFLWELLAARADLVLVTGDKLLLGDRRMRGRVISAQAFAAGV